MGAWWLGLILSIVGLIGLFIILGVSPRQLDRVAEVESTPPLRSSLPGELVGERQKQFQTSGQRVGGERPKPGGTGAV